MTIGISVLSLALFFEVYGDVPLDPVDEGVRRCI
jgi:hypothetical protein